MGLLSFVGSKLMEAVQKDAEVGGRHILPHQSGKKYNPPTDLKQFIQRYSSWVYACANRNAINCAQVPLRLYASKTKPNSKANFSTRTITKENLAYLKASPSCQRYLRRALKVEEILEHPFLDLTTNVNEFMNGFELLENLFLSLEITGNAYWHIVKDQFGSPIEIWPIMSQYMKPTVHTKKFILGYEFSINNVQKHYYEYEEIIHYKYPNPKDPVIGMGKLEACVVAADLSAGMNTYETSLLNNSGRPDMALILPADAGLPPPEEQARMRRDWFRRHGGTKKAGNLAILSGGADLKSLTLTPKEMNFLKGRQATLEEIAGVFGVPLSKLITKDVNRANAETGNYTYSKDTILPMLQRVEQKMNEQLLPLYDQNLFVSFENPVPEDKEFKLKERESNIKSGYTSINEEREKDGLEPVEWGDVPTSKAPAPAVAPIEPEPKKFVRKPEPSRKPDDQVNPTWLTAMYKYFLEIKKELLSKFDEFPPTTERTFYAKIDGGDFSDWFDMQKWNKRLAEVSTPFVRATFMMGGRAAIQSLKTQMQFEPISAGVGEVLQTKRAGVIVDINATTARQLRKQVAEGLVAGENKFKIRKRIEKYFKPDNLKIRTERIVRTEQIWAFNEGEVEGYKQSGVVEAKEWLTAQDDRLCEFCEPMNGKIVGLDDNYFAMGETFNGDEGGNLTFSYEDVGHPPLHPNCRCAIIPVLKEI